MIAFIKQKFLSIKNSPKGDFLISEIKILLLKRAVEPARAHHVKRPNLPLQF